MLRYSSMQARTAATETSQAAWCVIGSSFAHQPGLLAATSSKPAIRNLEVDV